MKSIIMKNKFLVMSLLLLIVFSFIDFNITITSLDNALDQIISMLMIVPPIFILIGLFDVWVPREQVIALMGDNSGIKGMFLAFFLGAFSAGPTIAAFPIAMIMIKKGAKYSNVLFFLMVWSSLKLPIVFYQVVEIGWQLSLIINLSMLFMFIIGAYVSDKLITKQEHKVIYDKALEYTTK